MGRPRPLTNPKRARKGFVPFALSDRPQTFGLSTRITRSLVFALFLNSAWSFHCAHKLACGTPCFIGLTSACFAHSARPSCAPPTVAQCSGAAHCVCSRLQPFGPPTASDRGGNAFFRFAPPCVSLARCSVPAHFVCSALQPFGPSPFCKRLHPQFAIVDLHRSQARLQLSLLTGLTSACFRHRRRPPCAPQKMPEMTYTPSFLI